jgi:UDP-N-acetylmuramoylalanine--D-glutamate ligase
MKIAIAGYGVEGEANYNYWARDPENDITIVDEADSPKFALPEGVKTILGSGAFQKLDGFDIAVRTAGLSPFKIKTDGKIWSATNEFFDKCPAQIIGVTGTKGKGTTSSMITAILEAAGKKVWLVGNIGLASLEVLDQIKPDDVVVYELSSFQLWDLEKSPHIAVVLAIEAEHLNVHKDMKDYVDAKGRIRKFQTKDDVCVYHPTNEYARLITLANHEAPMMRYASDADGGVYVREGQFYEREHNICSTDVVKVPGAHNVENACAAITVARRLHVSDEEIARGLERFKGLPHRLAYVATVDGVKYYDDSIATTPTSAIAALRAFDGPKVIILGGSAKGSDFTELGKELLLHEVQAILIGVTAPDIAAVLESAGFKDYQILSPTTMSDVVKKARELAKPGSYVLLSPSAASFDMFKDYADRGDQFIQAVKSLS